MSSINNLHRQIHEQPQVRLYATIDWVGNVVLCDENGKIWGTNDRIIFSEYYKHRNDFPCNPQTGEPLEVWRGNPCNAELGTKNTVYPNNIKKPFFSKEFDVSNCFY